MCPLDLSDLYDPDQFSKGKPLYHNNRRISTAKRPVLCRAWQLLREYHRHGFFEILLVFAGDLGYLGCFDHAVLLHGSLVYRQGRQPVCKTVLLSLCVQYGSSFPDGHVHTRQYGRPSASEYTVQYLHHLSGIWRGTGGIHVFRFCALDSA